MKTKTSLTILLAAMLAMTACTKHEETTPAPAAAEVQTGRTIVYAAGHSEGMATLKTEGEWDAMLDRLCSMAAEGNTVTFYNMGAHAKATGTAKENRQITTEDRDEIKAWMKQMEKEGLTVTVTYDDNTGRWHGEARETSANRHDLVDCYSGHIVCVTMPATGDPMTDGTQVPALVTADSTALILKKDGYILVCCGMADDDMEMTLCGTLDVCHDLDGDEYLVLDISENRAEFVAGSWRTATTGEVYTLADDGTATLTAANGSTPTASDTWSLGADGTLCCPLLPADSGCWLIHWLSASTLVISNGNSQLVLERI